jgi:hypothetical protein
MAKLIERNTLTGDYNLTKQAMIVEMSDGRRIYLIEGFGGMDSLEGGQNRWRHGAAVQILPTDTLDSLAEDSGEYHVTSYERMMHGYDEQRPVLDWDGSVIDRVARLADGQ